MPTKTNVHGGRRPGAGRKPKDDRFDTTIPVSFKRVDADSIKAWARVREQTVQEFIREAVAHKLIELQII